MRFGRARLVGLLLTAAWIVAAGLYGLSRVSSEIHRQNMQCYRMQAEMEADPSCAKPGAVLTNHLCALRSADCSKWARIEPGEIELRTAVVFVPPLVVWLFVLVIQGWKRRPGA
jgi:hypothetical protein